MVKTTSQCEEERERADELVDAELSQASLPILVGIVRLVVAGIALGGAFVVIGLTKFEGLPQRASEGAISIGVAIVIISLVAGGRFFDKYRSNRQLLRFAKTGPSHVVYFDCMKKAKAAEAAEDRAQRQQAEWDKIAQPRVVGALAKQRTVQLRVAGGHGAEEMEYLFSANDGEPLSITVKEYDGVTTDGQNRVWVKKSTGISPLIFFHEDSVERIIEAGGQWSVEFSDGRDGRQTAGPFPLHPGQKDEGVYLNPEDIDLGESTETA